MKKKPAFTWPYLSLVLPAVNSIAFKSGLKRPTAYLILDSLQQKGLVSLVPRSRKVLFVAESPEKLATDLTKKQELVKVSLPNLLAIYNVRKEKPQVLLHEGKEAVAALYEKILLAKKVDFFCTINDVEAAFPDYPKRIMKTAMGGSMKFRELLGRNAKDVSYAKAMQHGENYQQRFLPDGMSLPTDNVLCDGSVMFFSYQPYMFAVQISSKGIYDSLSTLFELAWRSAEPFEKMTPEKT
jgi:DNA-binding MarR family transcriptional regulator